MKWEIKDNKITIFLEEEETKDCTCPICKSHRVPKDYEDEVLDAICDSLELESDTICPSCKASLTTAFTHNFLNFHKDGETIKRIISLSDILYRQSFNDRPDLEEEWSELIPWNLELHKGELIKKIALKNEEYVEYAAINGLRKIVEKLSRKQSGE